MSSRTWMRHYDPANPYAGRFTLGDRSVTLPDDAVVSLTMGRQFNLWRTIANGLVTELVKRQMVKNPNLLYAELAGDAKQGHGLTLSVWAGRAKQMAEFRDSGAHRFALRFFSWIFYSGKAQAYFLTFPANGRIPSVEEAMALCEQYGRHFDGGRLVRKAERFEWGQTAS